MSEIEAFILAGGASSRMGSDKARLVIDGETFIARIGATLRKLTPKVSVVGRAFDDTDDDTGLNYVRDVYPKWGALGGLHAALSACTTPWAAVVACDLPFVTADLLRHLMNLRTGFDAVVPTQEDDRPQPLCALYRTDPCLAVADNLIRAGHRRPLDLLKLVNTRLVAFSEVQALAGSSKFFVNINTPEDYYEAIRRLPKFQN